MRGDSRSVGRESQLRFCLGNANVLQRFLQAVFERLRCIDHEVRLLQGFEMGLQLTVERERAVCGGV
jgi:hypothetical protein